MILIQLTTCSNKRADYFAFVRLKLLKQVLAVLSLIYEDSILELFNLQAKKVIHFPQHGHLKFTFSLLLQILHTTLHLYIQK